MPELLHSQSVAVHSSQQDLKLHKLDMTESRALSLCATHSPPILDCIPRIAPKSALGQLAMWHRARVSSLQMPCKRKESKPQASPLRCDEYPVAPIGRECRVVPRFLYSASFGHTHIRAHS